MNNLKRIFDTDLLAILANDARLKADFMGLSDHIGIDLEEALMDAINHWVGQNAELFHYEYGTDLSIIIPKETN